MLIGSTQAANQQIVAKAIDNLASRQMGQRSADGDICRCEDFRLWSNFRLRSSMPYYSAVRTEYVLDRQTGRWAAAELPNQQGVGLLTLSRFMEQVEQTLG